MKHSRRRKEISYQSFFFVFILVDSVLSLQEEYALKQSYFRVIRGRKDLTEDISEDKTKCKKYPHKTKYRQNKK